MKSKILGQKRSGIIFNIETGLFEIVSAIKEATHVLCIKDGFMRESGKLFCKKKSVYKIDISDEHVFHIRDQENSIHSFTKSNYEKWFLLIKKK